MHGISELGLYWTGASLSAYFYRNWQARVVECDVMIYTLLLLGACYTTVAARLQAFVE